MQGISLQNNHVAGRNLHQLLYVYIYIFMCVYVYIYICICACIYVCIGTCIDPLLQTCPAFARAPLYSEVQQFELRWTRKLMHDPKYLPSWELQSAIMVYDGHAGLLVSTVAINLAHALQGLGFRV